MGASTAGELAGHFRDLEKLMQAEREALEEIEGIGEIVAEAIVAFFGERANRALVAALAARGVNTRSLLQAPRQKEGLAGKTFVITGTLEHYKRRDAEALIKRLGGKVAGSVSRKTDYVLGGAQPGSKADTARRLGIRILTEQEFELLVR